MEMSEIQEYSVKLIDTRKKSKLIVRLWHDVTEKFKSPTDLKARLVESFPDDLPDDLSFQVGYFLELSVGLLSHEI